MSKKYMRPERLKWSIVGLSSAAAIGLAWWLRSLRAVELRLHVLNEQKFVDADPAGLARAAGVPLDVYALASAMQSEEKSRAGKIAVGCTIRNYCREHKVRIADQLLQSIDKHGRRCPSYGHFGSQEAPGKWASTHKPPTAKTLVLAAQILQDPSPIADVTAGATRWYSPAAQDAAHARDPKLYTLDSRQLEEKLTKSGARKILVPGVPDTIFWSFT